MLYFKAVVVRNMKIDRLIGILTLLLRHDKVTAPELAERFEVSRRTISRDIEDLCKAGIPLVTAQGYGGGISIAEGYKIDVSLFTEEELRLLLSGLEGMGSVLKSPSLRQLSDKLPRKEGGADCGEITIDLASHYQLLLSQKTAVILGAIRKKQILSFQYYYEKGTCQRKIEPYQLAFKWSSWYVWGWCLEREDFRLFKLNRMEDVSREPETFSARELPQEGPDNPMAEGTILLRAWFDKKEAYRLIEEYGAGCYLESGGRLLFERNFMSVSHMRQWILSFGSGVEVVEPETLREELRQIGKDFLKKYGGT